MYKKRRYGGRKKTFKRRSFKKNFRRGSNGNQKYRSIRPSVIKQTRINKPTYQVKRFQNMLGKVAEKKYVETFLSAITPVSIAYVTSSWRALLTTLWPAQNLTSSGRVGDKIFIRYIVINLSMAQTVTNYYTSPLRVVIVKSLKGMSAPANYFDSSLAGITSYMSAIPYTDMPPIIYDSKWAVNKDCYNGNITVFNQTANTIYGSSKKITIKIMKEYNYQATSPFGNVFDKAEYYLYVFHVSDVTGAACYGNPNVAVSCKLIYTDV